MEFNHARVDDIPLIWCEPSDAEKRRLVIWLNGFGGNKESVKAVPINPLTPVMTIFFNQYAMKILEFIYTCQKYSHF